MGEDGIPHLSSKAKHRWWKYFPSMLLLITLVASAVLALWHWNFDADTSLPKTDDVTSMKVGGWCDGTNVQTYKQMPGFEVPENHWDEILAALSPFEDDDKPCPWVGLGSVEIKTARRNVHLSLFDTFSPVGAFAVNGRYYRGGNNVKVKQALENAYIEAERRRGNEAVTFPKLRTTRDVLAKLIAKASTGTQEALFKDRDEARELLGSPDAVYTQDQFPFEIWGYCCADGEQRVSIIEKPATMATGHQVLARPTRLDEFKPKTMRL
jgi:hypothetical protein